MSIHCNMDSLPPLDQMDPEAAYFSWKISIKTDKGEDAIRSVFEFAEWDCELEVKAVEAERGCRRLAGDELPMQPVPFDLSVARRRARRAARRRRGGRADRRGAGSRCRRRNGLQCHADGRQRVARCDERQGARPPLPPRTMPSRRPPAPRQTIRVDLDRVDRLINLVGELVINQAMLSQSVIENDYERRLLDQHGPRRTAAADPRDPGLGHGDPRPAGEAGLPAHGAYRSAKSPTSPASRSASSPKVKTPKSTRRSSTSWPNR